MTKKIIVVHCWSAPRSRSTALLYSFEARGPSCVAIDEPLYREWLVAKGDAVARPYNKEMIEGVPPEGSNSSEEEIKQWGREKLSLNERIASAVAGLDTNGVVFCKHMAKHSFLYDFENEFSMEGADVVHRHLLLIRDPVAVLSSWGVSSNVHGNNPSTDEVGIIPLLSIFSSLQSNANDSSAEPVVLDSDDLVRDANSTLADICASLSIEYKESMLTWESGPHKCDGPWAKVSLLRALDSAFSTTF